MEPAVTKSTAETNREIAAGLSNNLSRLLREFSRDFERRIWRGLVQRGYSDEDIARIYGLNKMRVYKQVW